MSAYALSQVDVFAPGPRYGNPVAVVHDADDLTTERMQRFAAWTNLSETTFLLTPTDPAADYRLRIFTPASELPFAGHPTLGSAHAWLERGGTPREPGRLRQECGVGLVEIRHDGDGLAFAAPPLRRSGPVEAATVEEVTAALGIAAEDVLDAAWIDNGPGWMGLELASADAVLALRPDFAALSEHLVAVTGRYLRAGPADLEVRVFGPALGINEDPVTGSAVAGLALWRYGRGERGAYVVSQGTVLGRDGRVVVTPGDTTWIGGHTETIITGTAEPR